jgi:hypothetical protein
MHDWDVSDNLSLNKIVFYDRMIYENQNFTETLEKNMDPMFFLYHPVYRKPCYEKFFMVTASTNIFHIFYGSDIKFCNSV